MQIDFLRYGSHVEPVEEFGLVDPDDREGKKKAYVSYDKDEEWNATVRSNGRDDYSFIPVDNNIPVYRHENGRYETESLCDAMLLTDNTLCFVELKNQRAAFLSKAVSQLENTISLFRENHDESCFQFRKAYVCNIGRPGFNISYKNVISGFYKRNRIPLRIDTTIECR